MGNVNTYTYNLPVEDSQYEPYPIRLLRETTATRSALNATIIRMEGKPSSYVGSAIQINILPRENITQVYVHPTGTLFFSCISNNVYTILNNTLILVDTQLRLFVPKRGMFVTRVIASR
jgi:hypothetical protein